MKNNQNGMTAATSREKESYIAPKMEVAILCEDVVMVSTLSEVNLYESGNSLDWNNEGWTSESANQKPDW